MCAYIRNRCTQRVGCVAVSLVQKIAAIIICVGLDNENDAAEVSATSIGVNGCNATRHRSYPLREQIIFLILCWWVLRLSGSTSSVHRNHFRSSGFDVKQACRYVNSTCAGVPA